MSKQYMTSFQTQHDFDFDMFIQPTEPTFVCEIQINFMFTDSGA